MCDMQAAALAGGNAFLSLAAEKEILAGPIPGGMADRRPVRGWPDPSCKEILFAATGVTDGSLLERVRFFGEGMRTAYTLAEPEDYQGGNPDLFSVARSRPDPAGGCMQAIGFERELRTRK